MVEVIRLGQIPEEKEYTATCGNCSTLFKFKRREAKVTYDQRDGNFLQIDCPLCKKTVTKSLATQSSYWDR